MPRPPIIAWSRLPTPVIQPGPAGEWNSDILSPGTVLKEDGLFKMWFYAGRGSVCPGNSATRTGIAYATSPDGIDWTLYDDPETTDPPYQYSDPVLLHGPSGSWDFNYTISPYVLGTEGGYEMWYSGWTVGGGQHIGYASSPDGIEWTRNEDNPVLQSPGWTNGLIYPSVLRGDDTYRMWFQGWQGAGASIGYATAPQSVGAEQPIAADEGSELHQNFPNPFARSTTITYDVARAGHVTIQVFDVLGKRIASLVDEARAPGSHSVVWEADDVASGFYYYRLSSEGFVATRAMLVLR